MFSIPPSSLLNEEEGEEKSTSHAYFSLEMFKHFPQDLNPPPLSLPASSGGTPEPSSGCH